MQVFFAKNIPKNNLTRACASACEDRRARGVNETRDGRGVAEAAVLTPYAERYSTPFPFLLTSRESEGEIRDNELVR